MRELGSSTFSPGQALPAGPLGLGPAMERWRRVTYAEMWDATQAFSRALLDRGLGPDRPVMILSANSVNATRWVLVSRLRQSRSRIVIERRLRAAEICLRTRRSRPDLRRDLARHGQMFERALDALDLDGVDIVFSSAPPDGAATTPLDTLISTAPGDAQAEPLRGSDLTRSPNICSPRDRPARPRGSSTPNVC